MVLVEGDSSKAKQVEGTMNEIGIQDFYLGGCIQNYDGKLRTSTKTVIDSQELQMKIQAKEDMYLLDVREPDKILKSKIKGSVNIPLVEIFQHGGMGSIPTDKPVVVIYGSGNRATIASYTVAQEGIDFQILEGGINSWNSIIQENNQ